MTHQKTQFVERLTHERWEDVEEHLFCCSMLRTMCGVKLEPGHTEWTESVGEHEIMCRICHGIQHGDDESWRCPDCGCGLDWNCGRHL